MPRAGDRLTRAELAANFAPIAPSMPDGEARFEALRCLNCFDAPCTRACPTGIDVPRFIRQIAERRDARAARTILSSNILGASCARACPTEVLCEGACVERLAGQAPIQIGRLQRFACDSKPARLARRALFEAGPATGYRVALVGSGPASLSCAHELRRLGHAVEVFEALDVVGGLDALALAAYKVTFDDAQAEIADLLAIGGIAIHLDRRVDGPGLVDLLGRFDAVFLGVGLGSPRRLGIEGEDLPGVRDALDFIEQTHRRPFEDCEVGRRVVVIGGGNTAIDAATAARRLGADRSTIAYRRAEGHLSAFGFEVDLAKRDGVNFLFEASPARIVEADGRASGVEFARPDGSTFIEAADMVLKALGQDPRIDLFDALPGLDHVGGKLVVDPSTRRTSVDRLYAGGDCLRNGGEVVDAVQDGKLAARGIDARLMGEGGGRAWPT